MGSKLRLDFVALGVFSLIFFISSSILIWQNATTFNSPDENANAIFAHQFAVSSKLWFDEQLNFELNNLLHPRSVMAISGRLLPVSFLGMPMIYGLIGKVFGLPIVGLVTPLLAIAAVFAWRSIVERLFDSRSLAFLSALAVLFHPSFWYYSGRLFMHNVPFVSFLILAVYFAIRHRHRNCSITQLLNYFLSGLFLALALWFRTSEVIWVAPLALFLLITARRYLKIGVLVIPFTAIVLLSPMLYMNSVLYGGIFEMGYTASKEAIQSEISNIEPSTTASLQSTILNSQLPFDIAPSAILKNIYHYAFELYPWLSITTILGALIMIGRRASFLYLIVTIFVTAWLFAFYGSWSFHDNPDPSLVTIGTSYVRYWLPVFVLWSPFVAQFLVWFADRMKTTFTRRAMLGFTSLLLMSLSVRPVFFAEDGLVPIRESVAVFAVKRARILELTAERAIIIVDRADKFVWPYRRVVQPLRSETTYDALPTLVAQADLYYFGISLPSLDLDYLNNEKLAIMNLKIEFIEQIGDESLYRISSISS
ncbi:MAG: hypothetical protein AAB337_00675 [Patescibacteria group bacterium]